jgi:hypothetical protein
MSRSGARRRKASSEDAEFKRTVIYVVAMFFVRMISDAVDNWIGMGGHH